MINITIEKRIEQFISSIKGQLKDTSNRLVLEIADITKGDNQDAAKPDSCPLFGLQEDYVRQIDDIQRAENSPMPCPVIIFALEAGSSSVNLLNAFFEGKTIDKADIYRLHEAGKVGISYTITYNTMRVLHAREIQLDTNWYMIVAASIGKVKKVQQKINSKDGSFKGNVAAGKDFVTGKNG